MDKLLLIDDEADVRYSSKRIFGRKDGLELHTAGSGEAALELIPQPAGFVIRCAHAASPASRHCSGCESLIPKRR